MADTPEQIQKSIKKYLAIGLLLIVFTVITYFMSYIELTGPDGGQTNNIVFGMIVATFKALLVALIFMHLNHERKMIYNFLVFTFVFVLGLFVLTVLCHDNPLVMEAFEQSKAAIKAVTYH
jgi:caa(3)-type oxidase subunit IV